MLRSLAVLLAGMTLLLSGCLGDADASDTKTPAAEEPEAPRPEVGECRLVKDAALDMNHGTRPRPCSKRHNMRTVMVVDLPEDFPRHVSERRLAKRTQECLPAAKKAYGGTAADRHLSLFQYVVILPTREEYKAGARWARCDVVALGDYESSMLPAKQPYLADGIPERLRACATRDADEIVPCTRSHRYRSNLAVRRAAIGPYPSRATMDEIGTDACSGQADGHGWYAWQFPEKYDWNHPGKDGAVTIVCYLPD